MRPRARKKSSPIKTLLSIFGGGMAAIPISILLLWNGVKTIGIEPMDPFEVGPLVANYVPWIVPESFRGSASSDSRRFPTIPSTPESSVANASSNESRKFPPIGGDSMVSRPSIEPEPSLSVAPSEPSMSTTPSESSLSLSTITPEPSLSMPATAPSTDSITDEEKFDQTLAEFDSAITHFSEDKPATAAIVFHKLETLGEIIAAERAPSLKKAAWKLKAVKCCETIAADLKILASLKKYLESDRSELFPDDIEILKPTISADYLVIESVNVGNGQDEWLIKNRAETKILPPLKVIVPQDLEIKAEPQKRFLVVGVVEEHSEMRKHVFRVLFATPHSLPTK